MHRRERNAVKRLRRTATGGVVLFAIISADWKAALIIAAFTALLAAWVFSEVRSVRVGVREVQLQRLIGARRVPYSDIMRIDLVDAYQEGVVRA